jgi:hypothetical protein
MLLASLRPITGFDPISGPTYGPRYWGRASQALTTEAGRMYALRLYAKHDTGDNTDLLVDLVNPLEANAKAVAPEDAADWTMVHHTFVAEGSTTTLVLEPEHVSEDSIWAVDAVEVREMPIQMAERAVDAVVSVLQSHLGTELGEIETEMADGITLPTPSTSSYYKRPKSEIAGGDSHVEVFEASLTVDQPYSDGAAGRVTYEVPITIRLTAFNRNNKTADDMMALCRRYSAALVRVITSKYRLGGTDDSIKIVRATGVTPYWDIDSENEDLVRKVRIEVPVTVLCEEVDD